jgi:GH15 family glucan-1,4-alpha-glucosidase
LDVTDPVAALRCDLPIGDYALLGDCHSAALVSRGGSIDWCCMPRFDADAVFSRLLDRHAGGHYAILPCGPSRTERTYLDDTLVLQTTFIADSGSVRLTDFFSMRAGGRLHPRHELVRVVEGLHGRLRLRAAFSPRFEYGAIKPWLYRVGEAAWCAVGSNAGLLLFGDMPFTPAGEHDLCAEFDVAAGDRVFEGMHFVTPEELHGGHVEAPPKAALQGQLGQTCDWWRSWAKRITPRRRAQPALVRSAIVLKALTYAPTGAIVAAPTTSLPEQVGGPRNWDYRYSWIRDSVFTVHALAKLGCVGEADGFRRFIQRSAAGNGAQLKALVAVDGKRRLTEVALDHLAGWRDSRPVRIGNGAERQYQADKYGLLLELAGRASERGYSVDPHYWDFLTEAVDEAAGNWERPDCGIWEVRGMPRHFVHSKAMCWAALQRGLELAQRHGLPAPRERWQSVRDAIRAAIDKHGIDPRHGHFVAAFGTTDLDAATLLLPDFGFVAADDPRMLRTADAVQRQLGDSTGLIRRYLVDDGLPGPEGAFLPCTFWLAELRAHQGQRERARALFERASACANELGLFPEEYDGRAGQMLGNFPQGLTHLAHIAAALALDPD